MAIAEEHCRHGIYLAEQIEGIDVAAAGALLLARLTLAKGNVHSAWQQLTQLSVVAAQKEYVVQIPQIIALQVQMLLQQGDIDAAEDLTRGHDLPLTITRIYLAKGNTASAQDILETYYQQMQAKDWRDEQLKAMVLLALAHYAAGDVNGAVIIMSDVLHWASTSRLCRTFLDEGPMMMQLLREPSIESLMPKYVRSVVAAFDGKQTASQSDQPLIEPLSDRELEVLQLIATGLSNREISERLFVALSTIKGHNRNIFDKLQVKRRTEAVARARELGLL